MYRIGHHLFVCLIIYLLCVSVYLHLSDGYSQIRLVEFVRYVPTQWTELPPLLNKSMKETQTK